MNTGQNTMRIFTVGYGGKKPKEFPSLLRDNGVRVLVDVRLRPNRACMGAFVKAKTATKGIQKLLAGTGIDYRHETQFAPTDEILAAWMASKKKAADWERYEDQFIPVLEKRQVESLFDPDDLDRACLMCAESRPATCHRRLVAEFLRDRWADRVNVEIIHL